MHSYRPSNLERSSTDCKYCALPFCSPASFLCRFCVLKIKLTIIPLLLTCAAARAEYSCTARRSYSCPAPDHAPHTYVEADTPSTASGWSHQFCWCKRAYWCRQYSWHTSRKCPHGKTDGTSALGPSRSWSWSTHPAPWDRIHACWSHRSACRASRRHCPDSSDRFQISLSVAPALPSAVPVAPAALCCWLHATTKKIDRELIW